MIHFLIAAILSHHIAPPEQPQHPPKSSSVDQAPLIVIPRMNRPDSAVIESKYQCSTGSVELKLALTGTTVQVAEYSDANGPASPDELSQWNEWLSDIKNYHTFGVACQGAEAVVVYVYEPNPQRLRDAPYVAVFWDGGEIRRLPFTPGPPGRL